jgi:hypothetical protein
MRFFTSDLFTDGLLPGSLLDIERLLEFAFEFEDMFADMYTVYRHLQLFRRRKNNPCKHVFLKHSSTTDMSTNKSEFQLLATLYSNRTADPDVAIKERSPE